MGWEKAGCLKGPKGDPGPRGPAGDENMAPLTAEEIKAIVGEGGGSIGGGAEMKLLWEGKWSASNIKVPDSNAYSVFLLTVDSPEKKNVPVIACRDKNGGFSLANFSTSGMSSNRTFRSMMVAIFHDGDTMKASPQVVSEYTLTSSTPGDVQYKRSQTYYNVTKIYGLM
ncbi:MAG: hypothetical protein KH142_04550 [Slackia piriformis]|uniref:Uncharacterized protein n=1 Tax=Slackia piriformis TaxID=626934 RepID=A0A943Z7J8_9ACTN|nr:hypothetical protein [Slackia piriformis]